jgi:hypothetical protein
LNQILTFLKELLSGKRSMKKVKKNKQKVQDQNQGCRVIYLKILGFFLSIILYSFLNSLFC